LESSSGDCSSVPLSNDYLEEEDRKRVRDPATDDTQSVSDSSSKKFKVGIPDSVEKKGKDEEPIPHPFPFPQNYRPDVQVGLKSGNMTTEARRQFLSSVAATMFSFRR